MIGYWIVHQQAMKKVLSPTAGATGPGNRQVESHSIAQVGSGMPTAHCLPRQERRAHCSTTSASEHMETETNCMVEVFDFETKEVKLMPAAEVGPGMVRAYIEGPDKEYWVHLAQIKMRNPTRYSTLNGDDRANIRHIMTALKEVRPLSFKAWKNGFRKDRHPGREIAVWMRIAEAYTTIVNAHDLSMKQKKELFYLVLQCSMLPREMVFRVVTLSALRRETAAQAVEAFYGRRFLSDRF